MAVGLAPAAARDIEEIGDYIDADDPIAAVRFVQALRQRCDRLAAAPSGGRRRDELLPGLRSVTFRRYVIFYSVVGGDVRVERVLHGARDIPAVLPAPRS